MSVAGGIQFVDVSKYQPSTPDLSDVVGLIARAGIGTKPDPTYDMHIAAARKARILTGAYWYNWGTLSVREQVQAFLRIAGNVDYYALDVEGGPTERFSHAEAAEFVNRMQSEVSNCGLYASESWFFNAGQDWDWIANYSREPSRRYHLWQYGPFRGADGDSAKSSLLELAKRGAPELMALQKFHLEAPIVGDYVLNVDTAFIAMDESRVPVLKGRTGHIFAKVTLPDGRGAYLVGMGDSAGFLVDDGRATVTLIADSTPFDQDDLDAATAPLQAQLDAATAALRTTQTQLTESGLKLTEREGRLRSIQPLADI